MQEPSRLEAWIIHWGQVYFYEHQNSTSSKKNGDIQT